MFKMKCTEMGIFYRYNRFINKLLHEVIKLGPYILDISKMYGPFVY